MPRLRTYRPIPNVLAMLLDGSKEAAQEARKHLLSDYEESPAFKKGRVSVAVKEERFDISPWPLKREETSRYYVVVDICGSRYEIGQYDNEWLVFPQDGTPGWHTRSNYQFFKQFEGMEL